MALDLIPPFDAIVDILEGLVGVTGRVYQGVPATLAAGTNAYVCGTAQYPVDKFANQTLENTATYFIGLSYAVRDAPADAERNLLIALKQLILALVEARKTKLSGTCERLEWDFSLANDPAYQLSSGREFRIFPVLVRVIQHHNFAA